MDASGFLSQGGYDEPSKTNHENCRLWTQGQIYI